MTTLKLGLDPQSFEVHLTTGADFYSILRYTVAGVATNWPVGTAISLVFDDPAATVWNATVVTTDATFDVDKATAGLVANLTPVKLQYVNGTTDRIWFTGKVVHHD